MATKYWWGPVTGTPQTGGAIQTGTNWSTSPTVYTSAGVPTVNDDVVFTGSGYTLTGTTLTCASFTVSGTSITFSNTGAMSTTGNVSVASGNTLSNTGNFTIRYGTINFGGNSLTGDLTLNATTDTCTANATTNVFTATTLANTPVNGTPIQFTGTAPAPLSTYTTYYVVNAVAATSFQVSLTLGGAAVDITTAGSGLRFYPTCTITTNSISGAVGSTFTLTSGAINLNGLNVTYGSISNSDGSPRIINFNSGSLIVTSAGAAGSSCYTQSLATNFSLSGTPNIYFTNISAGATLYVNGGTPANGTTEANSVNFFFNTNQTFAISWVGATVKTLTLAGTSGAITVPATGLSVYSGINCPSGSNAVFTAGTAAVTFIGSGAMNLTLNGKTFQRALTINAPGGTLTPDGNINIGAYIFTLTAGTYNFNNYSLTCDTFNNSGTVARTLAFGTAGSLTVTGTGTCYNSIASTATDLTNFSYTGTSTLQHVTVTNASTSPALYFGAGTEAQAMNIAVTGGGSTNLLVSGAARNLNFTGYPSNTSGTTSGTLGGANDITIYGTLTLPTVGSNGNPFNLASGVGAFIFASAASNTAIWNGKTIDRPITKTGAGTWAFVEALTMGATATSILTLTGGTIDFNNTTLTSQGFVSSGTTSRALNFNGGNIILTGTTPWTETGANRTANTTGIISLTSAAAKTFAGGCSIYPIVSQDGVGVLTFTGASLYYTIKNTVNSTVVPTAILFTPFAPTLTMNGTNVTSGAGGSLVLKVASGSSPTTGVPVVFSTGGTYPGNISAGTVYYVVNLTDTTFSISNTAANALAGTNLIAYSSTGSGTLTCTCGNACYNFAIQGRSGTSYTGTGSSSGATLTLTATTTLLRPGSFITGTFGQRRIVSGSGTTYTITPTTPNIPASSAISASNDISLASTTPTTKHYLSDPSGVVSTVQYVGIQDSQALGGAIWFASNESNDYGNNTGWIFVQATANFLMFMP